VTRTTTSAALLTDYLQLLQKLVQGTPSEQAEIVAAAQHDYETAPTPSRQLRFALILATPGHPATDLPGRSGCCASLWQTRKCSWPASARSPSWNCSKLTTI